MSTDRRSYPETGGKPTNGYPQMEPAEAGRAKRRKTKLKKRGFRIFSRIWSFAYAALLAVFLVVVIQADLIPAKYLIPGVVVLGLISLFIFLTLFVIRVKNARKVIALLLSIFLMIGYGYAIPKVRSTTKFVKTVTTEKTQKATFYVLAKKDSSLKKLEDLGETDSREVGTHREEGGTYAKARAAVRKRADVKFETKSDLNELADQMINGKVPAILLSEGHYQALCEKNSAFKQGAKILSTLKVTIKNEDLSKNVDVTKQSFNIYLSGLDTAGNIDVTARSDVNMIITVNPKTHTVLLTTLPRDMQIKLMDKGQARDKLTHTGIYGIQETIKSVENLTGISMNYYLKVNYSTVKTFIDAIGGIDVNNDITFTTHGQGVGYYFKKGQIHLDGAHALGFARERHSFEDGDVQRNRNQAKIIEAVIKKATSSETILSSYSDILNKCKDYMQINMTPKEISSIVKMQLNSGASWKVQRQSLKGTDSSQQCYSSGSNYVYVMIPDENLLQKAADNIVAVQNGER